MWSDGSPSPGDSRGATRAGDGGAGRAYGDASYVPALRFRWLTPAYDAVVRATTRERFFKAALVDQSGCRAGDEVLDLACGTGTLAVWLKQREPRARITGVDGDPAVLAIAARKASDAGVAVAFDRGLSYQLPYPDGSFDRVVSSLFFHHLSWRDKRRTASELRRVLRPGGELHIADWGPPAGPFARAGFLAVQLLDGFRNTGDNAGGRLPGLFRDAGFADVAETRRIGTVLGTLVLLRAARPRAV